MRYREEELARLQGELSRMLTDNQDLMDIKIKLDAEINAYRALLEDEESRWVTVAPRCSLVAVSKCRRAR